MKISEQDEKMLSVLREVAAKIIARKRLLGHYAVVWRDNEPAFIGEPNPDTLEDRELNAIADARLADGQIPIKVSLDELETITGE